MRVRKVRVRGEADIDPGKSGLHRSESGPKATFCGSKSIAFIEKRDEPTFVSRAQAIGLHYDRRTDVEAFNLGRVQRVSIGVFQSKDEQ